MKERKRNKMLLSFFVDLLKCAMNSNRDPKDVPNRPNKGSCSNLIRRYLILLMFVRPNINLLKICDCGIKTCIYKSILYYHFWLLNIRIMSYH